VPGPWRGPVEKLGWLFADETCAQQAGPDVFRLGAKRVDRKSRGDECCPEDERCVGASRRITA